MGLAARRVPRGPETNEQDTRRCAILVLGRFIGESIVIGDDVEVTVIEIRGDRCRIGITAPRTTSVHRKEVADAIRRHPLAPPASAEGKDKA